MPLAARSWGKHDNVHLGAYPSALARSRGDGGVVQGQTWRGSGPVTTGRRVHAIDLNLSGQKVFIALAQHGKAADAPASPYLGLDHFGLTVDDIDTAVKDLKAKGVAFTMDPTTARPGVKIAFLTAPQNVSIELIQRG